MSNNLETNVVVDSNVNQYEEVRSAMDSAIQAVVNSRAIWLERVQEAIKKAEEASLLAEIQAVRASELARDLTEQARLAAADANRLSREAKEAEAAVQYHQSLLNSAGAGAV